VFGVQAGTSGHRPKDDRLGRSMVEPVGVVQFVNFAPGDHCEQFAPCRQVYDVGLRIDRRKVRIWSGDDLAPAFSAPAPDRLPSNIDRAHDFSKLAKI
jgi:hypothetical protein